VAVALLERMGNRRFIASGELMPYRVHPLTVFVLAPDVVFWSGFAYWVRTWSASGLSTAIRRCCKRDQCRATASALAYRDPRQPGPAPHKPLTQSVSRDAANLYSGCAAPLANMMGSEVRSTRVISIRASSTDDRREPVRRKISERQSGRSTVPALRRSLRLTIYGRVVLHAGLSPAAVTATGGMMIPALAATCTSCCLSWTRGPGPTPCSRLFEMFESLGRVRVFTGASAEAVVIDAGRAVAVPPTLCRTALISWRVGHPLRNRCGAKCLGQFRSSGDGQLTRTD